MEVNEDERARVRSNFFSGIRLVVDGQRETVRGFVPIRRKTSEAFYAAIPFPSDPGRNVVEFYQRSVTETIRKQDGWSIRCGVPEGRMLTRIEDVDGGSRERAKSHCVELRRLKRLYRDDQVASVLVPSVELAADMLKSIDEIAPSLLREHTSVIINNGEVPDECDIVYRVNDGVSQPTIDDSRDGEGADESEERGWLRSILIDLKSGRR
jgi:hypothetical protein